MIVKIDKMLKNISVAAFTPVLTLMLFASCGKDSIMTYDATDNIYFDYRRDVNPAINQPGYPIDSLAYTFAYSEAAVTEAIIPIPIAVMGKPKATDRSFQVTVDAGGSMQQGVHYEMPVAVMRAGRLKDTLFLKIKRTGDIKTAVVRMKLRLQPNNDFGTSIEKRMSFNDTIQALTFKISVTDELNDGPSWSQYSPFFGTFSKKKMLLMNEIVDLPLNFWAASTLAGEGRAAATYYAAAMSRYLKEAALAGNTIYEEDGVTLMRMGADFL